MNFKVSSLPISESKEEVYILGTFQSNSGIATVSAETTRTYQFIEQLNEELEIVGEREVFQGKSGTAYRTKIGSDEIIFVGMGDKKKVELETLRKSFAAAFKILKAEKYETAAINAESFQKCINNQGLAQGIVEGLLMTSYNWGEHKSQKTIPHTMHTVTFHCRNAKGRKDIEKGIKIGEAFAEGVAVTRDFSNEPPNKLTPAIWAKRCEAIGKKYGISVKVLDKAAIKKEKMGGILAVNQGSENEPRLVHMTLKPKRNGYGKGGGKKVALVGKGLTFDAGGVSIKPSVGMEEMKHDKTGGCTVLGAMVTLAMLGVKNTVTCTIGMTDNMVDGKSQVPSDIFTSRSGKTVEVINTDAEGRLVLCDCLDYTQDGNPDIVIDVATLTGAVVVALGNVTTGIMGNDQKSMEKMKTISADTFDPVWQLPFYPAYWDDFKSETADMRNIGRGRGAGSQKAGMFLQQFIREGQKWIHADIAGTAWNQTHVPYAPNSGASGAFTRCLVQFTADWK